MSYCKIVIPWTPQTKAKVSLQTAGFYQPATRGIKHTKKLVKKQLGEQTLLDGALFLCVHYVIPAPLSLPEIKRKEMDGLPHAKNPHMQYFDDFLETVLCGTVYTPESKIVGQLRYKSLTKDKIGKTIVSVHAIGDDVRKFSSFFAEELPKEMFF